MKEENSTDPVLQESTRVKGIALRATQSSYDIEGRWYQDVYGEFGMTWEDYLANYGEESILQFYGVRTIAEYETPEIDAYRQEVDMLSMITADDPEIWVDNTGQSNAEPQNTGSLYHHAFHAREIKEFANAAGVPNVATYGRPLLYSDPSNEEFVPFLIRKINE